MKVELAGKNVVITGVSRDVGRGIALGFGAEGCRLSICSMAPGADELEEIAAQCRRAGALAVLAMVVDMLDESSVAAWRDETLSEHGPPDVLICNAGVLGPTNPIESYPVEEFERVLNVNLVGTFLVCKAFVPVMAHSGSGVIMNIASELGRGVVSNMTGYIASKWGVEGFTMALAAEVMNNNIIAVSVSPGMVHSGLLEELLGAEKAAKYPPPEDVGAAMVRLVKQLGPAQNGKQFDISSFM